MSARRLPAALLLLAIGCGRGESSRPAPAEPTATPAAAAVAIPPPRTTDGDVAVRGLEGQLSGVGKRLAVAPDDEHALALLVELLLRRAELRGRTADYDEALAVAARAGPAARARVLARLHRFAEAERELAGVKDAQAVLAMRAEVAAARGRTADAAALLAEANKARRAAGKETWGDLAAQAGLAGDEDVARAAELYAKARTRVRDASPFAVAWIDLQEALLHERHGDVARAHELLEIAHARLPAHAGIASHLAASALRRGDADRAAVLLEALLAAGADDPELTAQLGEVRDKQGRRDEATKLVADAAAGYDALLARHPDAFADHAARFWLGAGADPARAHVWAERNLANRATDDALELAVSAALAADATTRACEHAATAVARPAANDRLLVAAWRAFTACGRAEDAAAADARLRRPRLQ